MTAEMLFDGWDPPVREPLPSEDMSLSAGRRLTLRQAEQVTAGIHPLTRGPLHPLASRHRDADAPKDDPFTCGSCLFRRGREWGDYTYPKCWLPNPQKGADAHFAELYSRVTHGPASDVRAWWPACPDYSPGDRISNDAARYIPSTPVEGPVETHGVVSGPAHTLGVDTERR